MPFEKQFFAKPVGIALQQLILKFQHHQIDYCCIGGVALMFHGVKRIPNDLDFLISKSSASKLDSFGNDFTKLSSMQWEHTQTKTHIDYIAEGDYPGDGRKIPIVFKHPKDCSIICKETGIAVIDVPHFVEYKLAQYKVFQKQKHFDHIAMLVKEKGVPKMNIHPYIADEWQKVLQIAKM